MRIDTDAAGYRSTQLPIQAPQRVCSHPRSRRSPCTSRAASPSTPVCTVRLPPAGPPGRPAAPHGLRAPRRWPPRPLPPALRRPLRAKVCAEVPLDWGGSQCRAKRCRLERRAREWRRAGGIDITRGIVPGSCSLRNTLKMRCQHVNVTNIRSTVRG